ncbi:MAG: DUF4173 domain-containing protein [Chthoniobacterales bacterium]|nr:DUF4173 domain-containing protein [Chthoniobacterales bacterium]
MTTAAPSLEQTRSPRENIAAIAAALLIISGDFLFWSHDPGVSLGIFAALAVAALVAAHGSGTNARMLIIAGLLLPSAVQTGIELSLSNLIVLGALGTVTLGETAFASLHTASSRWAESAWALLRPIAGWKWLRSIIRRSPLGGAQLARASETIARVILPTAAVTLVFAVLLGAGNAILGRWIFTAINSVVGWFADPELVFARTLLWVALATFALTILRPRETPAGKRIWHRAVPDLPQPKNAALALWRSITALAVLNVLFFAANTADALYLWTGGALPEGVTYSEFVHHGVYSLIAAVVLSAVVIVLIFQQVPTIRTAPAVKALGLFWIAQNVVLITGVLLRLQRYVEVYDLSELRVYVGCFLLLVTAGLGLLTVHLVSRKGLGWLLLTNLLATFALFFVLQFRDVAKWVAESNVARWEADRTRMLDVEYLASLGASAIPSLIRVAEMPDRAEAHQAFVIIQKRKPRAQAYLAELDWRSWQQRDVRNMRLLATHEVRTLR